MSRNREPRPIRERNACSRVASISRFSPVPSRLRVSQERELSDYGGAPVISYLRGPDLSGSLEGAGGIGGLLARSAADNNYWTNWTHLYYQADGNGSPREMNAGMGQRSTAGRRDFRPRPDSATLSHGEIITYLVNSSQGLAARYRYDPYGNTLAAVGPSATANTYRFSSKLVEPNTGLYYYGYRWYAPNVQRWINRDPLGDQGFIALSFKSLKVAHVPIAERMEGPNLFTFVANRPTDSYDPNGTISVPGIPFPCPVAWVALYCIPECKARHAVPAPKCTITKLGGEIYIVMDCGCWIPPW